MEKDLTGSIQGIRINKYLSSAGICSRREADRMIEAGRVCISGRTASEGDRVLESDTVTVDGRPVNSAPEPVLLLFYKPKGLICSTKKQGSAATVVDYLHYPERIYPVGRLDKDSEGLLLMTNQGTLMDTLLRSSNGHQREYIVDTDRPVTRRFLEKMASGVEILGTKTLPCTVEKTGPCSFRITLTQGLNRQIRRMCEALGCKVVRLKRIRIENLTADGLQPGEYRSITPEEYRELDRRLKEKQELPQTAMNSNSKKELHK